MTVNKIPNLIGKLFGAVFIIAIVIIFIKSQFITPWKSPDKPTSYYKSWSDGRSIQIVILPGNKVIIWMYDQKENKSEASLLKWTGYVGTHYVGRIWNIDDNDNSFGPSMLGIRLYPEGVKPVVIDTEVINTVVDKNIKSAFPLKGDRIRQQTILFSDNAIRFQDVWLDKEVDDEEMQSEIDGLIDMVKA